MNDLIKVTYSNDRPTTSARDLWEFLDRPYTEFLKWFNQYKDYGFAENQDFRALRVKVRTAQGNEVDSADYEITVDMAKELAMLQKSEKGKKGLIPCVRISSRVLFSEEGLEEWVAQMEKASVAQPEQAAQYGTLRRIKG